MSIEMSNLEERIRLQQERLKRREPKPGLRDQFPWTTEMVEKFKEEIVSGEKCTICKHYNLPRTSPVVYLISLPVKGEKLPLPVLICNKCGGHFTPNWARKIAKRALGVST